jgi:MFS transporter, DHA1 family, inner membrane transport protein
LKEIRRLAPALVVGVMGNTGIYLIPLLVGAMVSDRGFTDQQAGLVASADLAGYAVMTFITAVFLIDRDWRRLALGGVGIMFVANLMSTTVASAGAFAAVRFLSGMGAGVLAAIATVSLGRTQKPDRSYGLLFAACLLFGTAGLWGLPLLLEHTGLNGAYVVIAALAIVTGFASRWLRQVAPASHDPASGAATRGTSLAAALILVAITLFWAHQNALYAYMERIGSASGLSAQFIGFTLGLANLTGFVGATLVAWLGTRYGRLLPLLALTVVQLACVWMLSGTVQSTGYLVAIGVISLSWNIVNPIQIGILASVDQRGRWLALSSTVIGAGLAIGPALGAVALGRGDYSSVLWLVAGLAVASTLLALPVVRRTGGPEIAGA